MSALRKYLEEFIADCITNEKCVPPEVMKYTTCYLEPFIHIGGDAEQDNDKEGSFEGFIYNFENFLTGSVEISDDTVLCLAKQRLQEYIDHSISLSNSYEDIRAERLKATNAVLFLLQQIQNLKIKLQNGLVYGAEVEELTTEICAAKINHVVEKLSAVHLRSHHLMSKALPELLITLTDEKCQLEESVREKRRLLQRYEEVKDSTEFCKLLLDYKKLLARKKAIT